MSAPGRRRDGWVCGARNGSGPRTNNPIWPLSIDCLKACQHRGRASLFTMNPLIDAFSAAWTRCFDYSGRSKRGDYWWFVLANAIISVVLLGACCA